MNSSDDTVLNFAYGSNMLIARIRERVPSAQLVGIAWLEGYELRWHKRSNDGSGKCNVVQVDDLGSKVFGVLYEVPLSEKPALDRAEGLGYGYAEGQVVVTHHGQSFRASLYCATNIDELLHPFTWYKALVVAGARQNGLPPEYIKELERAPASQDSNAERHAENMALVSAF